MYSETLEPLTWIRVCPSHCYKRSLSRAHKCSVLSLLNISKYTTFKMITRVDLSYIKLAEYLTLSVDYFLFFSIRNTTLTRFTSTASLWHQKSSQFLWIRKSRRISKSISSFHANYHLIFLTCSQFHQRFTLAFFCTKFWRQKFPSCVLGWKFFGAKILAKNACVKC